MRTLTRTTPLVAAIATCLSLAAVLAFCFTGNFGASTAQAQNQNQNQNQNQDNEEPRFSEEFWQWLDASNYAQWAPWPGQSGDFYEGKDPHGEFLKTFINRAAASNPADPPPGSIIVKENYGADKEELLSLTVMYRGRQSYDEEHKNWFWVKYNPDGSVATMNGRRIAGRVDACINCHQGAQGNDFIFSNDPRQEGTTQEGTTQEGTTQEGTTQEGTTQEGTTQEGTTQEKSGQEKSGQEEESGEATGESEGQ